MMFFGRSGSKKVKTLFLSEIFDFLIAGQYILTRGVQNELNMNSKWSPYKDFEGKMKEKL